MSRSPWFRGSSALGAVVAAVLVLALAAGCSGRGGGGDGAGAGRTDGRAGGESAAPAEPTSTTDAPDDDRTTIPPLTAPPATTPDVADDDGGDGGGTSDCAEARGWGTEPRSSDTMAVEEVYLVRAGRHDCYDRVVFDVNGVVGGPGSVGFHVAYAEGEAAADGSGEPVPTAGGAALQVVVRAPALGDGTSGHQPGRRLAEVGDDLVTTGEVAGWRSLREVRFAGSFEGQSTFAVGVDRRVPFRVGSFEADGYTRVYVDVAHP